jgi:hypothetical protein
MWVIHVSYMDENSGLKFIYHMCIYHRLFFENRLFVILGKNPPFYEVYQKVRKWLCAGRNFRKNIVMYVQEVW